MGTQEVKQAQQNESGAAMAAIETKIGRRTFTAQYKQPVLAEAAACKHGANLDVKEESPSY